MPQLLRGRSAGAVAAALALVLTATPAPVRADDGPRTTPDSFDTVVMTPAAGVAARTDRRPVAGGVYDRAANTTFISWAGQHEDNYVQAYDHRRRTWSAPVRVGDGDDDSHNYPTMVQADDGHLLVFRGMHNTELVVARSPKPHSIEGVWTEQVVVEGNGATYPMPFKTANGDIFVFVRETTRDLDHTSPTDFRPMKYVRSTDNGLTWKNTEQLTGGKYAIAPENRPDNFNEIYIGQLRYEPAFFGRPERVHIVYTLAGGGTEGNLHDRYHHNIYYTYFTPRDLTFHAADGRDLGPKIDDADQEQFLKVADTPLLAPPFQRSPDYISLVGSNLDGRPFVVWMAVDQTGLLHTNAGVWTRAGWSNREVATGVRVRDMTAVGPFSWRVYATLEGSTSGISTYLLHLGFVWQAGPVIETAKAVQRIEVITNFRDPARILATGASSGRDVTIADGDIYVTGATRRRDDD